MGSRGATGIGMLLVAVLSVAAVPASAQEDPCAAVSCSDAGDCFAERGRAFCLCEDGFAAEGGECVPAEPPEDVLRVRRRAELGERVVEVALAQERLGPFGVGRDVEGAPGPLGLYLGRNAWWCSDFVAWVYRVAGVPLSGGYEGGWFVPTNEAVAAWFARHGLWVANGSDAWRGFEPQPGDFVRFATRRGGHAAIVVRVEGDTLHTVEGNVDMRVKLGRYDHFRSNDAIDGIGMVTLPNEPPSVDLAEAIEVAWPGAVTVAAVVEDDGPRPTPEIAWTVEAGPGEVTFADPAAAVTEATFSDPGDYVLAVTAYDGEHAVTGHVAVDVWEPAPPAAGDTPHGCSATAHSRSGWVWPMAVLLVLLGRRR